MKGKNLQQRIPSKTLIQSLWRNQKLYRQAKAKRIKLTKPALQKILQNLLYVCWGGVGHGKPQLETRKSQMGKLTGKGKQTLKARNQPYTNMISKPAIVRRGEYKCRKRELHSKLRDQQLNFVYI